MLSDDLFGLVVRHRPIVCIDLLVRDTQARLLVGLRKNRPAQATWFVPGGNVRKDERLADAFGRISSAELGVVLSISDAQFVGAFEHFYPDNWRGEPGYGTHNIALAYALTLEPNELRLDQDQHLGFRWMSSAEALSDPSVNENTKAYCR